MKKDYLPWFVARLFLGGIFIFSGFLKLTEPIESFRGMIASYGVVPYAWISWIAYSIPWLEFIPGIFVVAGYFPRIFSGVLGGLAFSFIGLIAWAQLNGTLPANCGCFGDQFHMSPYQIVLLDTLNVLLAFKLAGIKKHYWCIAS